MRVARSHCRHVVRTVEPKPIMRHSTNFREQLVRILGRDVSVAQASAVLKVAGPADLSPVFIQTFGKPPSNGQRGPIWNLIREAKKNENLLKTSTPIDRPFRDEWHSEMQQFLSDERDRLDGLKGGNLWENHVQTVQAQITAALDFVPPGRALVVVGMGDGQEIPDEVFKRLQTGFFSKAVILDGCKRGPEAALKKRGVTNIEVIEGDFSGINLEQLETIAHKARSAPNVHAAEERLVAALGAINPNQWYHRPTKFSLDNAGLVIAAAFAPNQVCSVQMVLERFIAQGWGMPKPKSLEESLFWQSPHFLRAFFAVNQALNIGFADALKSMASGNGVVYVNAPACRSFKDRLALLRLTPEQVAKSFDDMMKVMADLALGASRDSVQIYQLLNAFFARDPHLAPLQSALPPGFLMNLPNSFWVRRTNVRAANAWHCTNRTTENLGSIFQSLTLQVP